VRQIASSQRGLWLVPASKLGAAAEMAAVSADGAGEHCEAHARGLPTGSAGTLVPVLQLRRCEVGVPAMCG
jgi:hypothetical protein